MDRPRVAPQAPSIRRSFERHLRAANRSERTVRTYLFAVERLERFLSGRGLGIADAKRADLEDFLAHLLGLRKASTAATYHKVLRILYRWMEEEEEIDRNPMARIKAPIVPEQPVPVIPEDGLRRLLAGCGGKSFNDRRDTAMIMLLLDTGLRAAELANLKLEDVDDDVDIVLVLGKGRRERGLPFGRKTALALDRYLRARARHQRAELPWLWLGLNGRLTQSGLVLMLRRRGREAGIKGLHPHLFRHTFAHQWLAQGGHETDLMRLAGWKSRAMLHRYGASAADERARDAHRLLVPRRPSVTMKENGASALKKGQGRRVARQPQSV